MYFVMVIIFVTIFCIPITVQLVALFNVTSSMWYIPGIVTLVERTYFKDQVDHLKILGQMMQRFSHEALQHSRRPNISGDRKIIHSLAIFIWTFLITTSATFINLPRCLFLEGTLNVLEEELFQEIRSVNWEIVDDNAWQCIQRYEGVQWFRISSFWLYRAFYSFSRTLQLTNTERQSDNDTE